MPATTASKFSFLLSLPPFHLCIFITHIARGYVRLQKTFQSWHDFLKGFTDLTIKIFFMNATLTLDDLILQYSENPFIEEKMLDLPAVSDSQQKQKVLSRLMLIASNFFNRASEIELSSYKRRYEYELK